ncbi:MAG: hypothetical protein KF688_03930 [Pirellulales bacterium]|nr:hypothetical protein [Pirellulales bacterium]
MFKKIILASLAALLVGGLVMGSGVGSYISTGCERVADNVKDAVPTEFQIDRARKMVRDLEPEIRRSMHVIAKEEVEVGELDRRIEAARAKADKDKSDIMRLQSDLKSGRNVFRYAGTSYSAHQVKEDLSRRFTRFKTADATLESLTQMRDARARNLDAARQKLTAMMGSQRQLQVEVENLEAKLKLVQVAEASCEVQFDDSQLARAKQLMADIRAKLDVAAKLANADTEFHEEIVLDLPTPEDVVDQVAEYFGLDKAKDVEIAAASFEK